MDRGTKSYRDHFVDSDSAFSYEREQYGKGSYSDILWAIERRQLNMVLDLLRGSHDRIDYLDFATGTGRILSYLEDQVDAATGVEISESMLVLAKGKVKNGKLICGDITQSGEIAKGPYDLITAFRFILNAEPSLRISVMSALASRLRDKSSFLVFNNHGNLLSHKAIAYPYYAMRYRNSEYRPWGNYLRHSEVLKILDAVGLRVRDVLGCGFFSNKLTKFLKRERAVGLEGWASSVPILAKYCVNQMYITQLK